MKLNINHKNLLDIINLHYKSYYPIKSFVSKEDFLSIVNNYRTKKNLFFPMPIYINISKKIYTKIKNSKLIKTIYKSKKVCDLKINSFFQIDKYKIGKKIFQTNDKKHPGLNELLKSGSFFIDCTIIKFNKKIMKNINFDNPQKLKSLFSKKKIKTIAGFHTRNAPHKAHEWIHKYGLKKCNALLIHPLIGQFKKGEFKENVVIKSNYKLVKEIYKKKNIFFALFNSYPRYAGPREALLHAIVRRNYGCTHCLVGRDHAGIGNYYKKYESQNRCLKFQKKLKIKIIAFNEPYLCSKCKIVVNQKCALCNKISKKLINGTYVRKSLLKKSKIPEYYMNSKISKILNKNSIILK